MSRAGSELLDPEVLRQLAVQRIERCLRPDDVICVMEDGRLAVCFGHGAHRAKPAALGARLASALGDRLAVGEEEHELTVAIGIGTGSSLDVDDVAAAAMASSDAGARLLKRRVDGKLSAESNGAGDSNGSAVTNGSAHTNGNGPSDPRSSRTMVVLTHAGPESGGAHIQRRDVVSSSKDREMFSRFAFAASSSSEAATQTRRTDLKVQVVGFEDGCGDFGDPTVEVLMAATRRSGISPERLSASQVESEPARAERPANEVVVLALGSQTGSRDSSSGPSTPWERWAQLTRSFVRAGSTVLAVGMGASVAAVAMCVREGAVGVLDLGDFAEQLEKISVNMASRRLAVESGSRDLSRLSTRSALPSPYNRLVDLTASEHRVLYQMMRGVSASEIADELVVSLATVRSHIRSILRKLQVSSQLAAVALANGVSPGGIDAA